MAFGSKRHADPIDRAVHDLEHQIAKVQREMRELNSDPAAPSKADTFAQRLKDILLPPRHTPNSFTRSRQDLFDVGAEPLKELEAEPIAFAQRVEPDLFATAPAPGTAAGVYTGTGALETAQVVPPKEKLAAYLGAGSIKTYKPLKHVQRQARNRFFMWLGLSLLALWIIWFVIR
ncbi:MAG: hypothetical protein ABSH14_03370 [Verrucomicrobiia bacterium]|jgi:hypothetical protein